MFYCFLPELHISGQHQAYIPINKNAAMHVNELSSGLKLILTHINYPPIPFYLLTTNGKHELNIHNFALMKTCGLHSLHKLVIPCFNPNHCTQRFRAVATTERTIRLAFHASLKSSGKHKLSLSTKYFCEDNIYNTSHRSFHGY
jgi:hypothetical protein